MRAALPTDARGATSAPVMPANAATQSGHTVLLVGDSAMQHALFRLSRLSLGSLLAILTVTAAVPTVTGRSRPDLSGLVGRHSGASLDAGATEHDTGVAAASRVSVYVGTYTDAASRGIYRFEMDTASGAVTAAVLAGEARNPSFLAIHPTGRTLYAVNEVGDFEGAPTGAVSAFTVDPISGALALLNQQPSAGAAPCHLVLDKDGRNVLVANYTGGTVAVLPLAPDGALRPAASVRQHEGKGPNKSRQAGPHAHAVLLDAAGRFAFEANLGTDRIYAYRFDPAAGTLEPNAPAETPLEPGAGPRHLAWHPSGQFLYAINELNSTITAFRYDALRGTLDGMQTVTTLRPGFLGRGNTTAEIAVSPDGRFLYGSNRGDDSLALFAINTSSGTLRPTGHVSTGGRTPRHFALDESGRWLLVANQDSDSIVVFRLDSSTGQPSPVGQLAVSKPVCVLFAPARLTPQRTERRP